MIGKDKLTKKEIEVLRAMCLFTCEQCEKNESLVGTLEPHRIIRGNAGGKYKPSNLKMLCDGCHRIFHGGEFK